MIVNNKYKVYWRHDLPDKDTVLVIGERRYPFKGKSTCIIELIREDKVQEVFATGESWVYKDDTFNRRIGMKESLKKAIEEAPKHVRKLFWDEFLNLRKK